MKSPEAVKFPEQQRVLANSMLHHLGARATLDYIHMPGQRYPMHAQFDEKDFVHLRDRFTRQPQQTLASARESLIAINTDNRLSENQRSRRLDRYMEAYCNLVLTLDHTVFPDTLPGRRNQGSLHYIPDGYIDMGRSPGAREQISVDKAKIFEKHYHELKELLSNDYSSMDAAAQESLLADSLSYLVTNKMRYNEKSVQRMKGIVPLHSMNEGVCRHQALEFQVLAQAIGLQSRIIKCHAKFDDGDPGSHAINVVQTGDRWQLYDISVPEKGYRGHSAYWRAGIMEVPDPTYWRDGETFEKKASQESHYRKYVVDDSNYWRIVKPEPKYRSSAHHSSERAV